MADVPRAGELDELSTEELRHRAFARAEHHRDIGFFWDLLRHLPQTENAATEDASSGNITGGLTEVIEGVRELFRGDLGDAEPMVRARLIDYLRNGD